MAAADSSSSSPVAAASATAVSVTQSHKLRRNSRGGHSSSPSSHFLVAESAANGAAPSSSMILPPGGPDRSAVKSAAMVAGTATSTGAEVEGVQLHGGEGNAAASSRGKKPAWNTPSVGSIEIGPVMDANSWPALSDAARALPRSLPADSTKPLPDGSGPVTSNQPPKHVAASNLNPNLSVNNVTPIRHKSTKKGGGSGGSAAVSGTFSNGKLANGGSVPPSLPTSVEMPRSEQGLRSRPYSGNGVIEQYRPPVGNHRRGNNSTGPHHSSYGPRVGQDQWISDWNTRPNFSDRDVPMQPHRPFSRPFLRPPPPPPLAGANFIAPPPGIRPFMNPMYFQESSPHMFYISPPPPPPMLESLRGMPPFIPPPPPPPPVIYPAQDPQLRKMLLLQIEYYFSPENLCNDKYLRLNMDDEGWVPITLIASFNRVKKLTNNIRFILEAVWTSSAVEVQGNKIRKRNDWKTWLLSDTGLISRSSAAPEHDNLVAQTRSMSIHKGNTGQTHLMGVVQSDVVLTHTASGESSDNSGTTGTSSGSSG